MSLFRMEERFLDPEIKVFSDYADRGPKKKTLRRTAGQSNETIKILQLYFNTKKGEMSNGN